MQITRTETTGHGVAATYHIPSEQAEAFFIADGQRFRAVRVSIFAEGYDGGVRGQDLSGRAWVWAVKVTKRGTDYKSGVGMHLGLTAHDSAFTARRDPSWGVMVRALTAAILADGWAVVTDDTQYQNLIFSRKPEPTPVRKALDAIEGVRVTEVAPAPYAVEVARPYDTLETSYRLVGWLHEGDRLLVALDERDEDQVEIPAGMVADFVHAIQTAKQGRYETPWARADRARVLFAELAGAKLAEGDGPFPTVEQVDAAIQAGWWGRQHAKMVRTAVAEDAPTPCTLTVPHGPHAVALAGSACPGVEGDLSKLVDWADTKVDGTAGDLVGGDRLLEIEGVPVGLAYAPGPIPADDEGLLVELTAPVRGMIDGRNVTLWFGQRMVDMVLDSDVKVVFRRPA